MGEQAGKEKEFVKGVRPRPPWVSRRSSVTFALMADDAQHPAAESEVLSRCYGEMRLMARRILAGNALGRVLQPTELANEAAVRLIRAHLSGAADSSHLLAVAARTMRRILIDEARKAASIKRSAPPLMTAWPGDQRGQAVGMAELDRALSALAALSPDRAEIVELRFMLGMTVEETAAATGVPERTVKRRWQSARAWLLDYLNDASGPRSD
jgi:RNA polymerase sigma factor (TIGR02999 family)